MSAFKNQQRRNRRDFLRAARRECIVLDKLPAHVVVRIGLTQLAIALGKPDGSGGDRESIKFIEDSLNIHYIEPVVNAAKKKKQTKKSRPPVVRNVSGVNVASVEFLQSYEWRKLRLIALKLHGSRCQCCGASPKEGAVMNVDHIKPRKTHPHLALALDNLQVLCHECNHGKGNWDTTDFR